MKVITEVCVRRIVKEGISNNLFEIPSDSLLTPAAKDFLSTNKITVKITERNTKKDRSYVNSYTGVTCSEKPEFMTHLFGNILVDKDDPRIAFRGKIDSLQAQILEIMLLLQRDNREELLGKLKEILNYAREILKAEVLEEPLEEILLFGLDNAGLRDRSHNAGKYYHVKVLHLPDISYGEIYIKLNSLRCSIRETELVAVKAFKIKKNTFLRKDIIQALNRLSSSIHILMCEEVVRGE